MSDIVLGIKIKSDGSAQVTSDINRLNASIAQTQRHARDTAQGVAGLSSALNAVKNAALGFAGISLGAGLAKDILDTNRSMEGLRAQLTAITGSQADAQRTFKFIQDFAVNTPFEIDGLTKSYIKLQNFGIRPTAQVMEAITNQASKLGASQETLEGITTALGQAYAKGKLQAEELMQLAERGVPIFTLLSAATGKNTAELQDMAEKGQLTRDVIDQVIVKMGELASGSNAGAMDTLNGKISNLSDSWTRFEDTLLNSQGEGIIKGLISSVTDLINIIERDLSDTVDAQIAQAEARINTFKSLGFVGQALADYTGYDIGVEVNRRDSLKKQQAQQQAAARQAEIAKASAAEIAKTQQWLDDIDAETADKKKKRDKEKETHARSAASAAESAAKQAAKAYQSEREEVAKTLASIQQETQLIGLSDTARARSIELQNALTKAKGAEVEQIRAALAVKWAMADAESVVQASQDAQIQAINEQVDRYQQLTLSVRELYVEKLKQAGLSDQQAAPVLARFDQNQGLAANAEKTNQAKQALDSYIQSLDSAASKSQDFSDLSASMFDSSLGGINTLAGAFDTLTKRIGETNEELRKNAEAQADNARLNTGEDYQKNAIKLQKQQQTLERQQVKDQLAGIRQMASATANMYAQNTNARRAFNVVALAASVAERAADLAGLGAKAASAVLTQGQGDPYTAFARIAAMAAIVGSVLSAAGAGTFQFGGSGKVPKLETAPDSGTVLGDPTAQSESIENVYGLLQDIHAREYRELQGINQGVTNLKQGITNSLTNLFQSGGLKSVTLPPSSYVFGPQNIKNRPYVSPITAALEKFIFGGLFGKIKYEVTGQGILIGKTLMSSVLQGAQISAQQYTEITKTKKSWFSTKTTVEEILSPLDTGVRSGLTQIFKGMGQSMLSMADSFGLDVTQKILSYKIPDLRIDLTDLNGTQAAKRVNNVLSTQLDRMTGKIFDDLIKQYQKMGEGLFETASRLKVQNAVVEDALASSGQTYNGDITRIADGISTLFGSIKDFSSAFQDYFSAFYTEQERVADAKRRLDAVFQDNGNLPASREAYRDLVKAQNLATIAGRELYFQLIDLADAADEYYSAQEELKKSAETTLRSLAGFGPTLESSIYNFNLQLIDARANWHAAGLDLQEMGRLTTAAFADLKERILEPFTSARETIANSIAQATGGALPVGDVESMMAALRGMTEPTQQLKAAEKIQKAIKTRYDNEIGLINKTRQAFNSIKEFLDGLKTSELSTLSPLQQLNEAKSQYITTLLKAQTNDQEALSKLPEVSRKYLEEARGYYASGADYAAIFDSVTTVMSNLIGTGSIVDTAQQAADEANASLTSSLQTLDDILAGFVGSLGAQFDAILSNTVTTSPVAPTPETPQPSTYDRLVANRAAAQKVVDDAKAAGFKNKDLAPEISAAKVAALQLKNYTYWAELGEQDKALKSIQQTADYFEILANTKDTTLRKEDRNWYKEMLPALMFENGGTVKFRASGGMTSGRTVFNEDGPELANFAHPTLITNNRNTQSIISLGNKQAVAELEKQTKELQALVRLQQASINAMLERLDKANETNASIARTTKLQALSI